MGPKPEDDLVNLFKSIGLTQAKAAEAAKNPKSAAALKNLIEKHDLANIKLDEKQAGLVAAFAAQLVKSDACGEDQSSLVVKGILEGRLKSVDQVLGMWLFLLRNKY
jgi:glutaminyl-tRNA synthetase